jgi:methionyl-tRNA formyltransferase
LAAIAASGHELVAVLTRPDAAGPGRGRGLSRPPVALWADEAGVPVLQPTKPGDPEFLAQLVELAPDCVPVVAYGALIPPAALSVPRLGWVNLHFSVLPAWRGAAPVQWTLLAGDEIAGASTFQIEAGLDTGPVYGVLTERVRPTDTSGDLLERLADWGSRLLLDTLNGLEAGELEGRPQPTEGVSHAPKLTPADSRLDWSWPALRLDRVIRACTPAPGAWTSWRGQRLKVLPLAAGPTTSELAELGVTEPAPQPGQVILAGRKGPVLVRTGDRWVALGSVQPAGKNVMSALDWARGARITEGASFE